MILLLLLALTSGVAIALGLMAVGLLEAPWPILLALLLVGLYGLQRLTAQAVEWDASLEALSAESIASKKQKQTTSSESSTDDGTTCTYRGVKYRASTPTQPSSDKSPTVTEGIYRGQRWQRVDTGASKQDSAASDQSSEIKYRGHRVKP